MKDKSTLPILTFRSAYDGYVCAIDTAERLYIAGHTLIRTTPDIALGLFELGQEEIGKSFSFLAAFGYDDHPSRWTRFWKDYRSHAIKVYRAFFYEWISPLRITSTGKGGLLEGQALRGSIQEEKEVSLYSNYESRTAGFVRPIDTIKELEPWNRGFTLLYLTITARLTKDALDVGDRETNYRLFSEIPYRILTDFTLQQDMATVFSQFAQKSELHKSIIGRIEDIPRKAKLFFGDK